MKHQHEICNKCVFDMILTGVYREREKEDTAKMEKMGKTISMLNKRLVENKVKVDSITS